MRITCPECGFSRSVPDDKVPASSAIATCPRCKCRFKFREVDHPSGAFEREEAEPVVGRPVRPVRRVQEAFDPPCGEEDEPQASAPPEPPERADAPEIRASEAGTEIPDMPDAPEPAASPEPPEPPERADAPEPVPSADAAPEREQPRAAFESDAALTRTGLEKAGRPVAEDLSDASLGPEPGPGDFPPPPRATWVPEEEGSPEEGSPEERSAAGDDAGAPPAQTGDACAPEGEDEAAPADAREPRASGAAGTAAGSEDGTEDVSGEESEPAGADKDGVRDIWSRLQDMDDGAGREERRDHAPARPRKAEKEDPLDPFSPEDAEAAESAEAPWERPGQGGFLSGFVLTLKKILFQPVDFFESLVPGRGAGRAAVFYLILLEFMLLVDFLWIFIGVQANLLDAEQLSAMNLPSVTGPGFFVALLVTPLVFAAGLGLFSLVLHGLMIVFQCAGRGVSETFRVVFYSTAPVIFYAVPVTRLVMLPVVFIWIIALQAIGLKKVQGGPYANALAAIFIVWSICMFAFGAFLKVALPGFGV